MSSDTTSGVIHIEKLLPVPAETAFSRFTEGMLDWWPHDYTWAGDALAAMYIEPRAGGHCIERDSEGNEIVWGTVLVWEPPRRLAFTWQIGPDRAPIEDPEDASEIEIRFDATGPSETVFTFEQRHFERHGETGDNYCAALASEQGWPLIFQRFAESFG